MRIIVTLSTGHPMRRPHYRARPNIFPCIFLTIGLALGVCTPRQSRAAEPATADAATWRHWVEKMKSADRGPFKHVRWFCKDGTVLEPTAFACVDHGGGAQHGEWTDQVKTLRAQGYYLANILEDLDIDEFVAAPDADDRWNQLLFEQFLIAQKVRADLRDPGKLRALRNDFPQKRLLLLVDGSGA